MAYFQITINSRKIELEKHQIDDLPRSYRDTISQLILYQVAMDYFLRLCRSNKLHINAVLRRIRW